MIFFLIVIALAVAAVTLTVRMLLRAGGTLGQVAWRMAIASSCAFLLSVALYEKPESFYVNFVIIPTVVLYTVGLLGVIATIGIGLTAGIKDDGRKRGLAAIPVALLAAGIAMLMIIWRAG